MWMKISVVSADIHTDLKRRTNTTVMKPNSCVYGRVWWLCESVYVFGHEVQENCFLPCGCADAPVWLSCHKTPERGDGPGAIFLATHTPYSPSADSIPSRTVAPTPTIRFATFESTGSTCASSPQASKENKSQPPSLPRYWGANCVCRCVRMCRHMFKDVCVHMKGHKHRNRLGETVAAQQVFLATQAINCVDEDVGRGNLRGKMTDVALAEVAIKFRKSKERSRHKKKLGRSDGSVC